MNKHFLALCIVFLLLAFSADFVVSRYSVHKGVKVVSYLSDNAPAQNSGILIGEVITSFNGITISDIGDFKKFFSNSKPGDLIDVNSGEHKVVLGDNNGKALFGVNVEDAVYFPYLWVVVLSSISSVLPWISAIFGGFALFSKEHSFLKLNALNALDIILTGIALLLGAQELNPLASLFIGNFGFIALAIVKVIAVVAISRILLNYKMHKPMQICVFIYAGAVLVNIVSFAHTMFL